MTIRTMLFALAVATTPAWSDTPSLRELTSHPYLEDMTNSQRADAKASVEEAAANRIDDEEIEELRSLIQNAQRRSLDLLPEMRTFANDTTGGPDAQSASALLGNDEDVERILIFASDSMSRVDLSEMMQAAAHRPDVTVVFRGIHPDETITKALARIQNSIVKAGVEETPPNVVIDPRLFRQFGVSAVPEILLARGKKDLIRAQGTYGVAWLETRYESGRVGDLGAYGTVHQIAEPDFLQMIQARVEQLDVAKMKRDAVKRFWQHQHFEELVPAPETYVRRLDPTIVNPYPITDADGNVLIAAGTRINPLEKMPFDWRILVFDPYRKVEIEFVREWLADKPETQRVQLIATRMPRENGWESLRDLENELATPVYLLTSDVRERFGLRYTPSELYAEERLFAVQETRLREEM